MGRWGRWHRAAWVSIPGPQVFPAQGTAQVYILSTVRKTPRLIPEAQPQWLVFPGCCPWSQVIWTAKLASGISTSHFKDSSPLFCESTWFALPSEHTSCPRSWDMVSGIRTSNSSEGSWWPNLGAGLGKIKKCRLVGWGYGNHRRFWAESGDAQSQEASTASRGNGR